MEDLLTFTRILNNHIRSMYAAYYEVLTGLFHVNVAFRLFTMRCSPAFGASGSRPVATSSVSTPTLRCTRSYFRAVPCRSASLRRRRRSSMRSTATRSQRRCCMVGFDIPRLCNDDHFMNRFEVPFTSG